MSRIVLAYGLVVGAAVFGSGPAFNCHAETVVSCYSEFAGVCGPGSAADGELSGEHLSPTDLGVFTAGPDVANAFLHRVVGSVEEIGDPFDFDPNDPADSAMNGTADIFTFEIAEGAQLNGIYLTEFISSSNAIFMGLDDGPTYAFSALELNEGLADLTQTLGFTLAGTADLPDGSTPGDRGTNLLEKIRDAGANNGSPFTVPLGPGQYSMYLQETGPSSRYDLFFSVSSATAIPEPSSAAAMLMLVAGYTAFRRKRG